MTDPLGLVVVGQRLESDRAVLACRVLEPDGWCRRCGCEGIPRRTLVRRLAHEPFGWRPTVLEVTLRRYRCVVRMVMAITAMLTITAIGSSSLSGRRWTSRSMAASQGPKTASGAVGSSQGHSSAVS